MKTNILKYGATRLGCVAVLAIAAAPRLAVAQPPPPPVPHVSVQVAVPVPVPPPPPAVTIQIGVPDAYVWDGYEYVGVVGEQYYYLGPDHIWLVMDSDRNLRFHKWEAAHHDWREHEIRNEKYRRDAKGHEHPWKEHDHDQGHDRDHR